MNVQLSRREAAAAEFAAPAAASAPSITRPQVRIVIVGHVDHGKSTLVGRLLHETGSLPDGKLEMLKAVSERRGMPFEWSFLLDALQTERDQGITIDTTQIRFRTNAREIVLIDAPGHAEFLRNMITGASQADAAVLIIDAAEGVRDQTRRHGYLLHLLGIRQVAIVINKMDRVGYSEARFRDISAEITAHLDGLGVAPVAIVPISARDGDGVAALTSQIAWYNGPTVVEALDHLTPARALDQLDLRLPIQAIYKFDDRRIVAGRIEFGLAQRGRRNRDHAGRQDREDQDGRRLAANAGEGRAGRGTFGRHYARPRTIPGTRRRHRPSRPCAARHAAAACKGVLAA